MHQQITPTATNKRQTEKLPNQKSKYNKPKQQQRPINCQIRKANSIQKRKTPEKKKKIRKKKEIQTLMLFLSNRAQPRI